MRGKLGMGTMRMEPNDECEMMNAKYWPVIHHSSFIIHHFQIGGGIVVHGE
ncbi:MAG: hypothetical protein ACREM1_18130 [Longimicrobiales bacterium]